MKNAIHIILATAGMVFSLAAQAGEPPEAELMETAQPPRWRISAGARFAPGVKADAKISSGAVADAVGCLKPLGTTRTTSVPKDGVSSTTAVSSDAKSDSSTEKVDISSGRTDFDGGFIDTRDDAGIPGETANWHFDDASRFDESTGSITLERTSSSSSSSESSSTESSRPVTFVSQWASFSETVYPDIESSQDADVWGGDFEIGYDFFIGESFSLGLGLGATFYRSEDAIRAAGRCYSASAELRTKTTRGHYVESTATSTTSSDESTSTTVLTDGNLAYADASSDVTNDDGSMGAGTADGYSNPYGGNNPVLTYGDGATRTSETRTSTETTVTRTKGFVKDGTSTTVTRRSRTIDVDAEGDVETREFRLALQPAWRAADWLELRGSFGAAATRVSVDVDATVFIDGRTWSVMSGDDDDWIVTGLCGIDAVVSPLDWLSIFVGADLRIGNNKMDYSAGIVDGTIELAKYTFRAGLGITF